MTDRKRIAWELERTAMEGGRVTVTFEEQA